MKVLIDIGHPAHVHLFKNFAWEFKKKGHEILFTSREKEFVRYLLEKYKFDYKTFGKKYDTNIGKIFGLIKFDFYEFLEGLKFKPDILLSHGSIYAAHASFFLGKPHISLEDTGNMEQVRLYKPFTDIILTPNSFHRKFNDKQIFYNGYHELAYLHPKWFEPNVELLKEHNLIPGSYVILRFISWKASHDFRVKGISMNHKKSIIERLLKKYKVFISAECELPEEFEKLKLKIQPYQIHDFLYYATLLLGESGTMTSECAVLGTPAIQISGLPKGTMGTLSEQEEYGLVYVYEKYSEEVEKKIEEILNLENRKDIWSIKKDKMLSEKIDVTSFLIWFVENFPDSKEVLNKNTYLLEQFKN